MLTELNIKNFRLFKHLKIEGLKRVNLFAGKNNSGKTALLEALRIIAAKAHVTVVNHVIAQRGQLTPGWEESYESLFNRTYLTEQALVSPQEITLNDVRIYRKRNSKGFVVTFSAPGFQGQWGTHVPFDHPKDEAVIVSFDEHSHFPLHQLWDKIALTDYEDEVIKIMKETLLPNLVRLDVKQDRTLVRLKGENGPIPIESLGDGAQRLLLLAIALVSAQNGTLLIDEIEAGLHYSITEKLWELIFTYANALNVQVFATTHSSDAIKTFIYVLEKPENKDKGAYFRLQTARKTGQVEAISYDLERLESALETKSEIR